jgi:cyclophilin family peptidyl-prolyl cis-trans isomerase
MRLRFLPLLAPLALLALAGCGGGGGGGGASSTTTDAAGCIPTKTPSAATRTAPKPTAMLDTSKTWEVTLDTNCGSFTFKLDPKQSPNASAAFVELVKRGYFDDTIFHRIVPGFVIQGGDPTQSGNGGPGFTTVDKPPAKAAYTLGVVAMAKTAVQPAGAAGSQFFVVTAPNAGLPPDYAIIGKVVSGLTVVQRIGKLGDASNPSGTPTEVVEIEKATVTDS